MLIRLTIVADVIIPAANIYTRVMEWAHPSSILVPDVGLKDGMMLFLLEKQRGGKNAGGQPLETSLDNRQQS